jgi:Cdc6-like AAA superfamily ATPase
MILGKRAGDAFPENIVQQEAINYIAGHTTNIRFGLCWLEQSVVESEGLVLEDHVKIARSQAIQRYQDILLRDFSSHHHLLLEAINQLATEDTGSICTGAVYERYKDLCGGIGNEVLSARRVSDFLKHLELLGIIDVTYHRGGKRGKTREIRLQQVF